jgi:hypothetical protein
LQTVGKRERARGYDAVFLVNCQHALIIVVIGPGTPGPITDYQS